MRRLVPSVLLALACVAVVGAAAPVSEALTRDARMKQGVRLLQVYVDDYAAEHGFVYPAAAAVKKGGGLTAPVWPVNPWTGRPMSPGLARGAYTYSVAPDGQSYALSGRLSSGHVVLTGATPDWLKDERAAEGDVAAARDQAAELGARVVKGYIEQYGMLHNGTAPAAKEVSATGAVGRLFPYWPANPYTGQPMATGFQPGDFSYAPGVDGVSYSLWVMSSYGQTPLNGAVPQQLRTAVDSLKTALTNANLWKIQRAVDTYALDYNDVVPAAATQATLGAYLDPWPVNPWTGQPMAGGSQAGDYTYAANALTDTYTITAHLPGTTTGDTLDGDWWTRNLGIRDRLKNLYCQASVQVVKEYVEEWKTGHAGVAPTSGQLTRAGAVGAAHLWWPANPWTSSSMTNADARGDFQYTPGDGGSYTLTVRQQPVAPYAQYYTAQ